MGLFNPHFLWIKTWIKFLGFRRYHALLTHAKLIPTFRTLIICVETSAEEVITIRGDWKMMLLNKFASVASSRETLRLLTFPVTHHMWIQNPANRSHLLIQNTWLRYMRDTSKSWICLNLQISPNIEMAKTQKQNHPQKKKYKCYCSLCPKMYPDKKYSLVSSRSVIQRHRQQDAIRAARARSNKGKTVYWKLRVIAVTW